MDIQIIVIKTKDSILMETQIIKLYLEIMSITIIIIIIITIIAIQIRDHQFHLALPALGKASVMGNSL